MSRSIVSKGKNVKDAIYTALHILGADNHNVDIEIIETEIKGIFGIGSKPATVRVSLKAVQPIPISNDDETMVPNLVLKELEHITTANDPLILELDNLLQQPVLPEDSLIKSIEKDGKVWIKDGHIYCRTAVNQYPIVIPGKGMKVYKNDVFVEKSIVIDENDIIQVELNDEAREPQWELKMDESKMDVILTVTPGERIFKKLKDVKPTAYIELEVEESRYPFPIEPKVILDKLKQMGVTHGIDYTMIATACNSFESGTFIIAKGEKPIPGKNGTFLPKKELNLKVGLKEKENGTVDYKEIREFPAVTHGEVIGIAQPPVPGNPGITVTGETVHPPDVYPLTIKEGRGVTLVEDGAKVVATDAGQPDIKIKGQVAHVSVYPKLVHGNDVNIKSGNIRFIGDVEITGSVQDGMLVEAGGNILVHQNINMSKVSSGKSIIVNLNIISSNVTAGENQLLIFELSQLLGDIVEQLKKMIAAILQLSNISAFKVNSLSRTGLGPLIKILGDGKFKSLIQLITSLTLKIKKGEQTLDPEWINLAERLHKGFILSHNSNISSVEEFMGLIRVVEEFHQFSLSAPDDQCFVKFNYAHNSQLYSSGDIISYGQGCYNSRLYAAGFVHIEGVIRGGEIYAQKGVKLKEAGTRHGISTKVCVPKDEIIEIEQALADTILQIGNKQHCLLADTRYIVARLHPDGELILH